MTKVAPAVSPSLAPHGDLRVIDTGMEDVHAGLASEEEDVEVRRALVQRIGRVGVEPVHDSRAGRVIGPANGGQRRSVLRRAHQRRRVHGNVVAVGGCDHLQRSRRSQRSQVLVVQRIDGQRARRAVHEHAGSGNRPVEGHIPGRRLGGA